MSLTSLINRPCVIVRRSASDDYDEYGNQVPSEETVETVCEIQQQRRQEPGLEGEVSITDWVAFFLPGEDVGTGDAVLVDGEEYELVGGPWRARNPRTQQPSHIEATARRTAGSQGS